MRNPSYARQKNRAGTIFWLVDYFGKVPYYTDCIPEEHMRLISMLELAEDNALVPGVGMRSEEQPLPGMVRYILDVLE